VCFYSLGVGGNLPVDSAQFLEFIPASHQYLLTVLSVFWAFGQLLVTLLAWALIPGFSCESEADCPRSSNMGWRYFLICIGGLFLAMWGIRFFLFNMYESPKFNMGRGEDAQAIDVMDKVADANGTTNPLLLEKLESVGQFGGGPAGEAHDTSKKGAFLRQVRKFDLKHVRILFASRRLAYSTSLIIAIWAIIGLAFPLYNVRPWQRRWVANVREGLPAVLPSDEDSKFGLGRLCTRSSCPNLTLP
jgi:MFS family permease